MTELRSPEELIKAYPDGSPELDNAGMPYSILGKEAAFTVALGLEPKVRDRLVACGLRPAALDELQSAHHDLVSAQAHWEAARVYGIADAAVKLHVDDLYALRDDLLAQSSFYLTTPDDVQRLATIREGDDIPDCIADARVLVQMIRPRVAEILDPDFKRESLGRALELADMVEKARSAEAAKATVSPTGQQMRRVRDRTVARVDALQREIRRFGKHAFRKDPKLSAAFSSEYLRRKRQKGDSDPVDPVQAGTASQPTGGSIGDGSSPFINR